MLAAGDRLGPYEIVAPVGAGGMGEVYRASDTRLNRIVAIKILPSDFADDAQRRERFRREAHAISSVTHPHICTLHDIGVHDGLEYLVMEYLPGETLAHRLRRGPLPLADVVRIATALADALDAAHRAGFTHRDLKPSNVMLTKAGVKVLDFGLAKWHGDGSEHARSNTDAVGDRTVTQVGHVVGTIPYMAPEQLEGHATDARSDLFALGAIVYEMSAGRRVSDESLLRTLTPPLLDRVVRKCLARDPAKRWQSASDLRDIFEWIAQTSGASAHERARAPSRRARIWRGARSAAAVCALVLAAFALARWRSAAVAPLTSFVILPPDDVVEMDEPTLSPDGRALAFIGQMKDGRSVLWVRAFESLDAHPLADVDAFAFPFWSPDGQSIAFFSRGQLKRVRASGGLIQAICAAPSGRGGTWSRDGTIVFEASADSGLSRVPAGGGEPTPVTRLDAAAGERSHRFPQFLSDGHRFIYTVLFANGKRKPVVKAASLDTSTTTVITETSVMRSFAIPGYLLFSRDPQGPFLAAPFDERTLALTAETTPIVSRPIDGPISGMAGLSASSNGVLAYQTAVAAPLGQLTWLGRSGERLGTVGEPTSGYSFEFFTLSTDGTRVALLIRDAGTSLADVWVVEVSRGVATRVTVDGTSEDPRWSPDDTRIAFVSDPKGTGINDLYVAPWNGSGPSAPLLLSAAGKFLWDWSRDGAYVIYTAQEGSNAVANLWLLPLKTPMSAPRRYLQSEFDKGEARFSPDTRWVAYESNESGRSEVYVQSFPEPGIRYQVSIDGGIKPRWRGDGRELFYLTPGGRVMAAAVAGTGTFAVSHVTPLFALSPLSTTEQVNYEVSADGSRFLVPDVTRAAVRPPVTIVVNWAPPGRR